MQTHAYIYIHIYIYMYSYISINVYIHAYRMHGVLDGIDFVFLNIWGDLQTPEPSGAASVMSTWHHNMNCSSQSSCHLGCHSNILKLTETIGLKGGIALVISSFPSIPIKSKMNITLEFWTSLRQPTFLFVGLKIGVNFVGRMGDPSSQPGQPGPLASSVSKPWVESELLQ